MRNTKRNSDCCPGFGADFKGIQDIAEKMSACCPGLGNSDDYSTMMKEMMERCCGQKIVVSKTDRKES